MAGNSKVKTILVTQPKPETEKNPYFDLAKKFNVKIDFRPFIQIEGIPAKDFRKDRVNVAEFQAVILTSRQAADHYFRMAAEMRMTNFDEVKFFCVSESTAFYLQKYITYRKRKVFYGNNSINDLTDVLKKHKKEKFLLPCSEVMNPDIINTLKDGDLNFITAAMYRTVSSDLSDVNIETFDMIVFFSPSGVQSLLKNFPKYKQGNTRIATFGVTTSQTAKDAKLKVEVEAPVPQAPSMTMAIEQYLKKANK
ncbi:MAG TPA: uroporphyrinogen-III synthase [Bacteroidia bacterium]|nr:uroporphyrinogen-III synthase [Bacteroidia bacterium]OQB60089.1 MAG: uroporphyrinogen-III synthase [Bacteroidetes bacterium ADurb.Bin141]QQR93971.1 MAG: uroporphyrinogen-III synthase [Bacteroidota bacterium]MBP7713326.1 uroporphyrinogen-III synthase [Bacteroidia bacterium]MBP8667772.1 uroporphyrinogen-III synthase [Bacteroidia bacterium]